MKIQLDPYQKEFLATEGDKILCTGRQVGKTMVCAMDCVEWAIKTDKKGIILMTAPQEFQAETLFNKTLDYISETYPEMLMEGRDSPTKTQIKLKKGIVIRCKTAGVTGFGLRSMTVIRTYVDECSQMPDMTWEAIDPQTLTTGGDTIYISTPFGMQGRFYECWINKDNAYDSFKRFSINSKTCIEERKICRTWTKEQRESGLRKIEQARARMTHKQFMQEYMGEFIESLMQFFPDKLIKACQVLKRGIQGSTMFLGVDVGGRVSESTFMVLERLENGKLRHCESVVENYDLTTMVERQILHLDSKYDFSKIYIDSGGIGAGVFAHLLEDDQTKRKIVPLDSGQKSIEYDPKNPKKKQIMKEDLYNNLLWLMENGDIQLLDDPNIFQSIKSVQFDITESKNLVIFGNYTHIVSALVYAAWCIKDKGLNIYCY